MNHGKFAVETVTEGSDNERNENRAKNKGVFDL